MATFKQQIFLAATPDFFPSVGFKMACELASAYRKDVCFLGVPFKKGQDLSSYDSVFAQWVNQNSEACPDVQINYRVMSPLDDFTDIIEQSEASMLIFQLNDKVWPFSHPQKLLDVCRSLRVPYFFVREGQNISFDRILVPVGFLMEEREKGPFSSSLGRYFNSEIMLMPAKDYGSRARQTADAIRTLLEKSDVKFQEMEAHKDSFHVEIEAADVAASYNVSLLMISASRDYGLDDILFGPKELKVIKRSTVPVMVINPRGDLYALCG